MSTGHAFLSYVREDGDQVDWLQAQMETAGLSVWRDRDAIWAGDDWRRVIRRAIQNEALVFIVCLSQTSNNKPKSVQREEVRFAIEEGMKLAPGDRWIIPVRFDDCEIPDYDLGGGKLLPDLHCLDLFGADKEENLDRLLELVTIELGPATERSPSTRSSWDRPYRQTIQAGTSDIDEFVEFAASRLQVTVTLDLAIDGDEVALPTIDPDGRQVLMVPNDFAGDFGPLGAEILLHGLDGTSDSTCYYEHGRHIIRGRFLIHGVAGPHHGIMSVSLRAVPGA